MGDERIRVINENDIKAEIEIAKIIMESYNETINSQIIKRLFLMCRGFDLSTDNAIVEQGAQVIGLIKDWVMKNLDVTVDDFRNFVIENVRFNQNAHPIDW